MKKYEQYSVNGRLFTYENRWFSVEPDTDNESETTGLDSFIVVGLTDNDSVTGIEAESYEEAFLEYMLDKGIDFDRLKEV